MKAYIYIENGIFLEAKAFGKGGSAFGEMVLNTNATGYQEAITDPNHAGTFIVFTSPEIGIVGANNEDVKSDKIHVSGVLMRSYNDMHSNFRAQMSLGEFFKAHDKFGIYDIDTRYLAQILRDSGNLKAYVSTEIGDKEELKKRLECSIG